MTSQTELLTLKLISFNLSSYQLDVKKNIDIILELVTQDF